MYFWRIEKLKAEMAARPLSERAVLPYLVVFVGACAVLGYTPCPIANVWDGLGAAWNVVLAVVGTIYVYRQNGGAGGQHFLQRYLAIGWVVIIRWAVIIVPVAVAYGAALSALGVKTKDAAWDYVAFFAIAGPVYYWRFGHHVGDLARRTKTV